MEKDIFSVRSILFQFLQGGNKKGGDSPPFFCFYRFFIGIMYKYNNSNIIRRNRSLLYVGSHNGAYTATHSKDGKHTQTNIDIEHNPFDEEQCP